MLPEPLVIKVLRALASVAVGNPEVTGFFEQAAQRDDLPASVRQELQNIRAMLHRAQSAQGDREAAP